MLTGQFHWRLDQSANLWSTLDIEHPVFPLLLEEEGYFIGSWRKSWGPGDLSAGGYDGLKPAGKKFNEGFKEFLDKRPEGKPFCFWLGASDPHRPYVKGIGKESGILIDSIVVPGFYPDVEEIRSDIADYYFEVQRFDSDVANALGLLEEIGELENTIIVMTGDNGIPFPRCKSNIYDMGVRVPLAIRWGSKIKGNRIISDFVSLCDLAPTFLEAAGLDIPKEMTGKSLLPGLTGKKQGWVEKNRKSVIFGKERHTPAQASPSMDGYPCRGIRTEKYLYIWNIDPERWPAGVPDNATHPMNSFSDCDNGPTKEFLMLNKDSSGIKPYFDLSFARRPAEELYNIENDPFQLYNLIGNEEFEDIRKELRDDLISLLKETGDPRVIGGGEKFDSYPYMGTYSLNL